jgi:hypothetical protein
VLQPLTTIKEIMAKKKVKSESEKEAEYVASGLDISYSIPVGLCSMLATATKTNKKEVWCRLSEMANICAARLVTRLKPSGYNEILGSSWTTQTFPGSQVKLRLDMDGYVDTHTWDAASRQYVQRTEPRMRFSCRIKIAGVNTESFTQTQINDYITDKILLGDDEEFCGVLEGEDEVES